jgi:hypothetical protein
MDALSMHAVAVYSWRKFHSWNVHSLRSISVTLLLTASLSAENSVRAQLDPSEYDLKAAFLYQFLAYVSWPEGKASDEGKVLIGVVGAPELADNLATLANNQPDSARAIEVRTLAPDADPGALHVVFVAADLNDEAEGLLRAATANAVLTITEDLPRPENSIINFEIIDDKVRFDIALGLARQSGLEISARLLQVASRIVDQP